MESPLNGGTIDEVAAYELPNLGQIAEPRLIERWTQEARYWYEESPYVVMGEHPVFGVLELACWLCGNDYFLHHSCGSIFDIIPDLAQIGV